MSQAPKPPDPFDPVEEEKKEQEEQIDKMINEGGKEPPSLNEAVQEALESFQHLNKGGAAPHVEVEIDGNHTSARWEKPKK